MKNDKGMFELLALLENGTMKLLNVSLVGGVHMEIEEGFEIKFPG